MHTRVAPFGWSCAIVIGAGLLLLLPIALSSLDVVSGDGSFRCAIWCWSASLVVLGIASRWLASSMRLAACVIALIAVLMIVGTVEVLKAAAV